MKRNTTYHNILAEVLQCRQVKQFFGLFALLVGMLIMPTQVKATHIIGGEMTYQCLGNDQYEVRLTVYRDCFYGDPAAWFDDPASIGIFDAGGTLVNESLLNLQGINDTLTAVFNDPCLFVPDDVCVHTTYYTDTITLAPSPGGYQVVYQRCCRNETIDNIIDPVSTGATFSIDISETALEECNSSAIFNDWPPIFICVNEPIDFDHSAIDVDGDSLVYRLCTPLEGASLSVGKPQPPNPPPYDSVQWNAASGYGLDNLLGFGDALEIDSETGLITGVPAVIGQYVVGICVEEYRNGELISALRRDFQYNVGQCGAVVSTVADPYAQCDDFTINFINGSDNATSYLWMFNDPNNPGATSTEENPSYTYADPGEYTVVLIAEPGSVCADTVFHELFLQYNNSLTPALDAEILNCLDSAIITGIDLSVDTATTIAEWDWVIQTEDGTVLTSEEQTPTFIVSTDQVVDIQLTVTSASGCVQTTDIVEYEITPGPLSQQSDSLTLCLGESTELNPNPIDGFTYSWSPSTGLDDPTSPNPTATPEVTTTYNVIITSNGAISCEAERSITVVVDSEELDFNPATDDCNGLTLNFQNTSTGAANFTWDFGDGSDLVNEPNPSHTFPAAGTYTVTMVSSGGNCINGTTYTEEVEVIGTSFAAGFDWGFDDCSTESVTINFTNTSIGNGDIVGWVFSDGTTSTDPNPTITLTESTSLDVQLTIANPSCTDVLNETIEVSLIENVNIPAAVVACSESVELNPGGNTDYTYEWSPATGLNGGENTASPTATLTDETTYTVTITNNNGSVPCQSVQTVTVTPSNFAANIGWGFDECSAESVVVSFTDASTGGADTWLWEFSDGTTSTDQNPTITVTTTDPLEVQLTASNANCSEVTSETIQISLIENVNIPAAVVACSESIELNPGGNTDYTYEWSPATGLNGGENTASPTATLTDETTYTVTITNSNGSIPCQSVQSVTVTPANFAANIAYVFDGCSTESVVVSFTDASTGNPDTWLWEFSDGTTSTDQNPTITLTSTDALEVQLTASNANCSETISEMIDVSLLEDVEIPETLDACGGSVDLNPTGNTAYDYEWSPNDVLNGGGNDANPTATITTETTFTVTITNNNGAVPCQSIQSVTVTPVDGVELIVSDDITTCEPDMVTLTATSSASDITWEDEAGVVVGTGSDLVVDPMGANVYTAIAVGELCEASSSVTVNGNAVDVTVDNALEELCLGESVDLALTNNDPSDDLTATWSPALDITGGASTINPTITPTEAGVYSYTVDVENALGCTLTETVELVVVDPNATLAFDDQKECDGLTVTFTNNSVGGATYLWDFGNGETSTDDNPVYAYDTPGTYMVTLSVNANVSCAPDPIQQEVIVEEATVSPGFDWAYEGDCTDTEITINFNNQTTSLDPVVEWNWDFGNGLTSTDENPTIEATNGDIFDATLVVLTEAGCTVTLSQNVNVTALTDININSPTIACQGEPITLNPGGNTDYTYDWSPAGGLSETNIASPVADPDDETTYTVVITNADNTCTVTQEVTVTPTPVIDLNVTDDFVNCDIASSITASGTGLSYEWTDSNGNDLGDEATIEVDNMGTETYTVIATDENGCSESASTTVVGLFITENIENEILACQGEPVELNPGGVDTYTYNWEPTDGLDFGTNGEHNPIAQPGVTTTYNVTITNVEGLSSCELTKEVTVVSTPEIEMTATDDFVNCEESAILEVSSDSDLDYEWFANGISAGQGTSFVVNNLGSVTYTIIGTDEFGCTEEETITVVGLYIDENIPEEITICDGQPTALNPGGLAGYDFEWSPVIGLDLSDPHNPLAFPTVTTTYTAVITNALGSDVCEVTKEVTVIPSEVIELTAPDDIVSCDLPIELSASTNLDPEVTYEWTNNGDVIGDAGTISISPNGLQTYTITATNAEGCTASEDVVVNANGIDFSTPNELTDCQSEGLNLNPGGNPDYTYQWSGGGLDSTEPDPFVQPSDVTTYSVTITNTSAGESCETLADITVTPTPPFEMNAPDDLVTCEIVTVLEATSDTDLNYTWVNGDGEVISLASEVIIDHMGLDTITVVGTDDFGCTETEIIIVNAQGIDVALSGGGTSFFCEGDTEGQLSVTNLDPNDDLTYDWSPDDDIISGDGTSEITIDISTPGTTVYTVNLSNQFNCSTAETITAAVIDTSDQSDFIFASQCEGTVINFINESINGPYYIWDFGDPSTTNDVSTDINPSYEYPGPGTYIVTLTLLDAVPCDIAPIVKEVTVGDSPTFVADFGFNYEQCAVDEVVIDFEDLSTHDFEDVVSWEWVFNNGESTSSNENPTITVTESQTVDVELTVFTELGCEQTITGSIDVSVFQSSDLPPDAVQTCAEETVELNPNGNDTFQYEWTPATGLNNPNIMNPEATVGETTIYTVLITNISGDTCQIMEEVTVNVDATPDLVVSDDQELCEEQDVELTATTSAGTIEWYDTPELDNVIGTTETITVGTDGRPDWYYVAITDDAGCTNLDSVSVGIYDVNVEVAGGEIINLCIGDDGVIELINGNTGDELDYEWTPNDSTIDDPTSPTPTVSPSESTSYTATVTNQYGCTAEATAEVIVTNLGAGSSFNISADPDTIYVGQSTQLTATEGFGNYDWSSPNTLDQNGIFNPVASPEETTTYTVNVEENGCTDTRDLTITVLEPQCDEPFIFFPRAFTPNGDGVNDVLYLRGNYIDVSYFVIYNRWGEKVYESNSLSEGWDGTFKGKEVAPDVYGFYLRATCLNGQEFYKQGNVTVLK